jgi:cation diffusion facilitator family transporter
VVKEVLFRYTIAKGKALESPAVVANAWHHRSDALSSIGAAVGIGGALSLGQKWAVLDPLASIVVGAMLVKVAWDLLKSSTGELTDMSLPEDTEREIEDIIRSFPEVTEPHNLRTRRIGNRIAIEAHVRLGGEMSLREAHDIVTAIEQQIKARFGAATLVTIHMEPR